MKSGKRLDSAVFQLTPTRTRYDLVIYANGKTEKIASGLLNPFLDHLKTAQDQIAKGGYSITLEPVPGSDSTWFTKGTVERFIRFVSNPEVLERVNTIESEIMQIEEAIVIQGNENVDDQKRKVEDHPTKSMETNEGSRPVLDTDAEKAIVLYTPGVHPPEPNKSAVHEEHSRVQLLRVLETRRTVLQKEQGMAFARAVAAGFDMDHMPYLVSFAECFGALRLMDACLRFSELWKVKHESGQWLEIEQSEAMAARPDLSPMNAFDTESNCKANNDACTDKRPPMDAQPPPGQHEFIPTQFQHPMFPQWPVHSQPGAVPVFQAYPMQGIPYYPNYPGGGPFFQPPYPSVEDPRFSTPQRMGMRRHSMESKDSHGESDSWENGITSTRSQDGSELEKEEGSQGQESRRKAGRSSKKQSSKVVIRNINYITSNRQDSSGSETQSDSNPETDEEPEGFKGVEHKKLLRSSKSEEICTKSTETWNSYDNNGAVYGQETDGGNWKAFQTCLLRDDSRDMFSMEKEAQMKRRKSATGSDPIVPYGRDSNETQDGRMTVLDNIDGKVAHKLRASDDEMVISQREFTRQSRNGQVDVTTEIEGSRGRYKRGASDDFMIGGQESQSNYIRSQSDPLNENGFNASSNLVRNSTYNAADESFIIPLRSGSQDQSANRSSTAIDMDPELPPGLQKTEDSSSRIRSQLSYEPDALSLIPERRTERESIGYDPALEYEMQVSAENAVSAQNRDKEDAMSSVKQGSKDKKSKGMPDSLEKRKIDAAMKRGKPSKLNPPNEAQSRADKLRAFKADLQKMKREKDEEDRKRIEALKMERQKRIAARNSSSNAQPSVPSQTRSRQPLKLSPSSHKGSKFSDSEPGSSSPLQRVPIRTSNESHKITKPSKLNIGGRITGSGLSRSVSSLPELKKQSESFTPEPKVSTRQIRRLSEPKMSKTPHVSSVKLQSTNPSPKPRVSDGTETKKISAIMSLDKTKAATLPELKIKTSRGPPTTVHKKPMVNEIIHNVNGDKSLVTSESTREMNKNEKSLHDNNVDENPVIEKTVVMLEPEIPSIPVSQETGERMETRKGSCDSDLGEKNDIPEYAAIHAPPSPLIMDEVVQGPSLHYNHQVPVNDEGKEFSKFSTMSITEKPYQAPYARVSSLEDRSTRNSDYTTASPRSPETLPATLETARVNGSEFKDLSSVEQILESTEKPRGKESSKGFKRFLKLGKKNHSSSADQRDVESDKLSMDGPLADDEVVIPAASNEALTLKNLISQSETPTTDGTPQKASRTFSLLSPFRSKTSGKKLTTS